MACNMHWIIDFSIKMLCLFGFAYQFTILYMEYMSGETINQVVIKSVLPDHLPGVTICFPGLISLKKLSRFNYETHKIYNEYLILIEDFKALNENDNNDVKSKINELYYGILPVMILKLNISLHDLLANYSIDYMDNVEIWAGEFVTRPIESVRMYRNWNILLMQKCITYFSALDTDIRQFRRSYDVLYIDMVMNVKDFPIGITSGEITFAVHSPNTFARTPILETTRAVKYGCDEYQFYKVRTELLDER